MTSVKPLKIVLVGDPGTGKTNLWSRVTRNHFNPKYEPSSAMIASSYTIHVGIQTVEADLWDFAGGEEYRYLVNSRLCDADGILLVYDISNPATFENLTAWLSLVRQATCPKTVVKLVGNKNDLLRMVSRKRAEQFANDNDLLYIETSALTNSNVHLAFEGIAQELDVTMHSVSEPSTHSFSQKDLKAPSGHSDAKQEKPFKVVLIEIEQAARDKYIVCVEKPLEEANLEFIAISYRWGEVQEQVIDTKLGYLASITSFMLDDFYRLCRDIMMETELQSIKYVWVDAICVDQNNHDRRKATIYQMSNIYHRAAYILAVPDLHLRYLKNNQIFGPELRKFASLYGKFVYYLLHGKSDKLVQNTEKWYDAIGIPKEAMARKKLISRVSQRRFTEYLQVYKLQDADIPCRRRCQHNCYDLFSPNCHNTPNTMLDCIQYSINECHRHSKNTILVYENNDCALCSLQMDMCKHQRKGLNKNEIVPDSDQKWLACVLRELQYDRYRNLIVEQAQAVDSLTDYLENLIKDWSSRVWVISEYSIAKAKQSRQLKFWFLSLNVRWEDVEKPDFFVFDFDKTEENDLVPGGDVPLDFVTQHADTRYRYFQKTLMSQLNRQSFLEMMLRSKASRNEDRFYAIFPSSEYKNELTSREVVTSWQIDNIISVKLKLYELMTTKDKLQLLYLSSRNAYVLACHFPAFANITVSTWELPTIEEQNENNCPCNFDLNNNDTLRLVPPDVSLDNENGNPYHKLSLSPKTYYALRNRTDYINEEFGKFFDNNKRLWEILGINFVDDEMAMVYIPMYMRNVDDQDRNNKMRYIALFGSFKKSKWLLRPDDFGRIRIKGSNHEFSWKCYDNRSGRTSFDIY